LELSPTDQQALRELQRWQHEAEIETKRTEAESKRLQIKDSRKERKQKEASAHKIKREQGKVAAAVQKRGKSYSKLLRNLEFDPVALERLEFLDAIGDASQIDEQLGIMNVGQVKYRDSIDGTAPKTYEAKAGYDYRIYFYQNGPKIRIRLVGDKGTQASDCELLRRESASAA
jgi:hypothetical protein